MALEVSSIKYLDVKPEISEAIRRVKEIILDHHLETFHRYRQCGQIVLEAGYRKGEWNSEARKQALEEWGISRQTFDNFIQLGEMTDEEFANAVSKFKSLREWANRPRLKDEVEYPPLPEDKVRTLIIDPPWPTKKILRVERPLQEENLDYETLTLTQIKDDIGNIIKEIVNKNGCHIYLWTTHKFLPNALDIFKAWGVNYECLLTWVKPTGMTPFSWMYNTEHILFGRIGNLPLLRKGIKLSFEAPSREHSRKPDIFYDIVREVSPSKRLDMFGREPHEGFEVWGNETTKFGEQQ